MTHRTNKVTPVFAILIPTAGEETKLSETLASLTQCTTPDNYLHTIVVENGEKYEAETITRKYELQLHTQYLFFHKGNKSAALNYALSHISDDTLIFFTDDDVRLEPQVLMAYEQTSRERNKKCYYGGPTFAIYEKKPPLWLLNAMPASTRGWQPDGNDDYLRTPRFLGFNWAAYAGDIKALGGFNENLGPGTKPKRTGQEWNMQERMLAKGFTAVYVEDARVWHHVPKDKSSLIWFIIRRFQGGLGAGMWFVEKHGKGKFPMNLIKYFTKSCLLLPVRLLSLSRTKMVVGIGDFSAGLGRIKGYFTAVFS